MNVITVSDLMVSAAAALDDRDIDALDELLKTSAEWLQSNAEAKAQQAMLNAMIDAAVELRDYEGED